MRKSKPRKKREYTLADLKAMVEQLGGRLRLQIYPAELDDAQGPPRRPSGEPARPEGDRGSEG